MNKKRLMIIKSAMVVLLVLSARFSYGGLTITTAHLSDSITNLNQPFTATISAVSNSVAPITYELKHKPTGMTIGASTGIINWTPTSMSQGTRILVKASNGSGADSVAYNLYISNGVACDTNIISYWPMDAKTSTSTPEAINGYDGKFYGSPVPTLNASGQVGKCINFNPVTSFDSAYYVQDASQYEFNPGVNFSISFWFKNENSSLPIAGNEDMIGKNMTNNAAWYIRWRYSTGKMEFYLRDNGYVHATCENPTVIDDNNWHFVVATLYSDPAPTAPSIMHLFVDGVPSEMDNDFWTDKFSGTGPLTIGYFAGLAEPFSGELDEITIWKKELLQGEVNTLLATGQANNPVCQQGNIAPLISSTAITTATQDIPYSYHLTYSEIGGKTITLSAPVKPAWLTFNTTTGLLSGTPRNADVGNNNVTLRVSDGTINVDQVFVINVINVNDLPIISTTPATSVNEDVLYTYTITATDADAGSSLTYSAPTLPSWMTFNATTHVLSGTPTNAQVVYDPYRDYPVVLRVTDNTSAFVEQSFTIRVNQVNDAPVINSQNTLSTLEDVHYIIKFTDLNVTDVDNVYPTGFLLTVHDGSNYTHSGDTIKPALHWYGVLTIPISLSDGQASVNYDLSITVSYVDYKPYFNEQPITGAVVDSLYDFVISTSDVEGQARTLTCPTKPSWLHFSSILGNGELRGTPSLANVGDTTVKLKVTDGTGDSTLTFTLHVVANNYPPVITSDPIKTAKVGELYSYTITATDQDLDELSFGAVTKPSWLTFSTGLHKLSGLPVAAGDFDVTLSVTDGIATVQQSFVITVEPTSIYNISNDFSKVYPNPATGSVNFEFENVLDNANLKVFTMSGELVKEVNLINQKTYTLDISDLKSNGYIYLITTSNGYQTGKLIVK